MKSKMNKREENEKVSYSERQEIIASNFISGGINRRKDFVIFHRQNNSSIWETTVFPVLKCDETVTDFEFLRENFK